ncbi:UNVERIFIED_CONTAM: hypothetical protein GTU68_010615 [Idotea baltica]|nr:hypothetical protein [Idotea baltica]
MSQRQPDAAAFERFGLDATTLWLRQPIKTLLSTRVLAICWREHSAVSDLNALSVLKPQRMIGHKDALDKIKTARFAGTQATAEGEKAK